MERMQAPPGLTAFAHQGHPIEIDGEGIATLDSRHVADFTVHGFTPIEDPKKPKPAPAAAPSAPAVPGSAIPAKSVDPAVVAMLDKLTSADPATLARISALLAGEAPPPVEQPVTATAEQNEPIPAEGKLTEAQIERMTTPQMKAWLKDREIPVVPPIDADVLRAKVRHANQG